MVKNEEESVVFPVVLYDGERQTDVGNITIHPSLDFKQFQKMLKETVGISYNNLTTYLVDNNTSPERRKILITGKVNFAVIVLERNCYFLVVLKRSRRDRRRKPNNKQVSYAPIVGTGFSDNHLDIIDEAILSGFNSFGDRFVDLEIMKQNYVNSVLNWNYGVYAPVNAGFPTVEEAYDGKRSRALCKECMVAEKRGTKAAFHFCVYDDVV